MRTAPARSWGLGRRLGLIEKFALLSLLCIVAITIALGAAITGVLSRSLIHHDGEIIAGLASELVALALPRAYLREPGDPAVYAAAFDDLTRSRGIVRLILYDRQGRILWSDDPGLIGRAYRHADLVSALAGAMSADLIRPGAEIHQRALAGFTRLEEIYAPIRDPQSHEVIGVFEVYRHPPGLLALLDRSLALVWMFGGGGGLALYLALCGIVRGAARRQTTLEAELVAHAAALEGRVDERTRELAAATREARTLYDETKTTKEYLESVLHSSADAIVTCDPRGRITFVSRAGARTFGCAVEAMVGTRAVGYWARGAADLRRYRRSLAAKGRLLHHETELRAPDGRRLCVSISAAVMREPEGTPGPVVAVVRDVSELRQLREQMARTERLAAAALLAAGVAHEVGQPLSHLASLARLLRGQSADPVIRHGLDDISAYAAHIGMIVNELTPLVRPVAVERRAVSVAAILDDAVRMASYDPGLRRMQITATLPPDLPPVSAADDQLLQVFLHLVANAADAGGDLTITANAVGGDVGVTFADTGHGMTPEEMQRVFDPFYSTRSAATHSGLGLFVSHEIIRQHGGYVTVESQPGAGSIFTIVLPSAAHDSSTFQNRENRNLDSQSW